MTGWVSARQDVDWAPLLKKTPQFEVFVKPPKDVVYYVEPILPVWDEIQSRIADQLTAAYVDPEPARHPAKVAAAIHEMAAQTDSLLKEADLYGTDLRAASAPGSCGLADGPSVGMRPGGRGASGGTGLAPLRRGTGA